MAEQKLVDLLQDDERGALHPLVRHVSPILLDAEIEQSGFLSGG
jgi:hypothetical protein